MKKRFTKYWLPVILWAIAIFIVSSFSRFPEPARKFYLFEDIDKFYHALEYAIFAFLIARALKNAGSRELKNNFRLYAIIFAFIYGVSDELHQYFIPMRQMSAFDLLFDGIGACIGQFFYGK